MNEKQEILKAVYRKAVGAGLCGTQKEFADLVGISKSGMSSAMNGDERFLTASLVRKVTTWAKANGLEEYQPAVPQQPRGVFIPEGTMALYENLSETCRNLSAILRQLNVPVMDAPGKHPFLTNKG